ncbi:MAG: rhodanese-like domain-containing protein, partial [Myxococcota bacterium]
MAAERIDPAEAQSRLDAGEWKIVDVRSVPEFEAGHPAGAYNVPFMHKRGRGLVANSDFARVMGDRFARDDKLILSCRSGARSLRATEALLAEGFSAVVDMRGGFAGEVDRAGTVTCAGWQPRNLP